MSDQSSDNTKVFIGFDFSINKPAASFYDGNEVTYYFWCRSLSSNNIKLLTDHKVVLRNRDLTSITLDDMDNHELNMTHLRRATDLADMILSDVNDYVEQHNVTDKSRVYISSEGLSMGRSIGNSYIDLATYKAVMLHTLYLAGYDNFKTYTPISIKAFAGCATKDKRGKKDAMIEAFLAEESSKSDFERSMKGDTKLFKKKVNYATGVDDLVDSYWCLRKLLDELNTPF